MMLPYAYSSSMSAVSTGYDVFLSFRGEDTRNNFIGHLYDALTRNDITTFKDDKTLEIGNHITSELLEAIDTSRIAIVVLSANFATSKWCLKELARIADCMKRKKMIVIPIFYHVSPSDVRHQSNNFVQGFADHELDTESTQEIVETWRAAFEEVGLISGMHVTGHSYDRSVEAEVIKEIVRKVLSCLRDTRPTDVPNGLVGIDSRVEEVKRKLRMESNEVLFIAICGKSGIGKTTLAEAVYENIKHKFEKSSFIESIKDISKQNNCSDLRNFQQTILDDIFKEKKVCVQTVKNGQDLLSTRLRGFKVIIVLDDVNNVDQLTYLAGRHEWFGAGSRIIITSKEVNLVNAHKVNDIYWCEDMKDDEALSLFCRSAFDQTHPMLGYENLSNDFVKLAGGLPSALNAYGKLLYGKDKNHWKETLKMQIHGASVLKGNNTNNQQQQQHGKGNYGGGKNVPNFKVVSKDDESEDDYDDDDFDDFDDDDDFDDSDDMDDSRVKKPVMVGNQGQMANILPQLKRSGQIPPQIVKSRPPQPPMPFVQGGKMPQKPLLPFVQGGHMPRQQMKHGAPPMVNNGGKKEGGVGGGGNMDMNNGNEGKKGGMGCVSNTMGMNVGGANPRVMGNYMPLGSRQKGPWVDQMGHMMPMGSRQMGPWVSQMNGFTGDMQAVQGLSTGPKMNGDGIGRNLQSGGPEMMAEHPYYPQQLMIETMMNQHMNGGGRFHPMMYAWPPAAVNYMQPQLQQYQPYPLHHYPHPPQRGSFIRCFSVENTSCCSIM